MKLNWMSGQVIKHHKQSDKAHEFLVNTGPHVAGNFKTLLLQFSMYVLGLFLLI